MLERANLPRALQIDGAPILEPGAAIVWFTFPGQRHDIGRFHLLDGTFTGLYADVLEPVEFSDRLSWRITDLYLDVWLAGERFRVLDTDELDWAVAQRHVAVADADAARREVEQLEQLWRAGLWPPAVVHEWTLEHARTVLQQQLAGA